MLDTCNTLISGRYRLLRSLRRGGMSEVFLACDEQTQQQVAIKIATNSDPDCISRLQREVSILRKLSHPHILPLLDDGISGSYYYLVMPYMQRGNLRERLARRTLTAEEAELILHQLLDALGYAHKHGIIHRDIKPSNILLDTADASHIYLADFGIAKVLQEKSDITQAGCLVGTPEYMAPELAEEPESTSSDIYAAGILLYQMLTGQLPFTGNSPLATFWKHIREQPASPSSLNPDIPGAVEQVILQALHKDPRHRFFDAPAMSLAYTSALNGSVSLPVLASISTADLPSLPPAYMTVRKIEGSFAAALPANFWRNRAGKAMQRSILSAAALLLLAFPISLGLILAHTGAQLNAPMSISRSFGGGIVAGKTFPAHQTAPMGSGGGKTSVQTSTGPSTHPVLQISWNVSKGDNQGQGHEHGHGHGHGHGHKHNGD